MRRVHVSTVEAGCRNERRSRPEGHAAGAACKAEVGCSSSVHCRSRSLRILIEAELVVHLLVCTMPWRNIMENRSWQ